ncbi:GNAT family N-acetyltransferase [Brevibacillus borstelensis]|uniref:GNAT family N-acetyltransferase n=1 Tax=Brevibacillus borstelensis TaxID=45462 RepID=UPI0030C0DE93
MIAKINFADTDTIQKLFDLQKAAYQVEAELINFFDIPPLKESFQDFQQCGEEFFGYFIDNELAGAISYTVENGELTICRMVVDPNHFRKGIAQKLLSALELHNADCSSYKVATGRENTPAKNLYVKNHYKWTRDIEVAPNFYISFFEKEAKR